MRILALDLLLCAAAFFLCLPASNAAEQRNILNMSEGTVVLSYSGEYNDTEWSALNVFDGNTKSNWCSPTDAVKGQSFLVELPQKYKLQKVAIDCSQVQEQKYPGISPKTIEVWGSSTSSTSGFTKLSSVAVSRMGRAFTTLAANPEVQWLKFVVAGNWGYKKFVEISEIEAYGVPVGKAVNPSFTGIFSSNWGPMKFKQDGMLVSGCYPHQTGSVRGAVDGHVLRFDWRQKGNGHSGTALMVLNSDGTFLNGAWYRNGQMQGEWLGKRDDSLACDCEPVGASSISDRLRDTNRAIVYGIYFDLDSSVIKAESQTALTELLAALKEQAAIKVQVEGHTDSTNTDQYNQLLSQKRAQAVLAWLKAQGIPAARMVAKGFGESKPVADNTTPQGRALNRRVEVSVLK